MRALLALVLLTACDPGEPLGRLEQGVCVCPELDAGTDAGPIDAGTPDAATHQRVRLTACRWSAPRTWHTAR